MLDAVLRIQTRFLTTGTSCKAFVPSPMVFKNFTSKMYDTNVLTSSTTNRQGTSTDNDAADDLPKTLTLFGTEDEV